MITADINPVTPEVVVNLIQSVTQKTTTIARKKANDGGTARVLNTCFDFLGNVFSEGERFFPFRNEPCYECECNSVHVIEVQACRKTACFEKCPKQSTSVALAIKPNLVYSAGQSKNACCAITCDYTTRKQSKNRHNIALQRLRKSDIDKRTRYNRTSSSSKSNDDDDRELLDDEVEKIIGNFTKSVMPASPHDAGLNAWLHLQQKQQLPTDQSDAEHNLPMPDGRFGSPLYRFQGRAPTVLEQLPAIGSGLVVAIFILAGLCILSLFNNNNSSSPMSPLHSSSEADSYNNTSAARRRRARRRYEMQQRYNSELSDEASDLRFWGWPPAGLSPHRHHQQQHRRDLFVTQNEHNNAAAILLAPSSRPTRSPTPWFNNSLYRSPGGPTSNEFNQYQPPPSYWLTMLYNENVAKDISSNDSIVNIHHGCDPQADRAFRTDRSNQPPRAESPPPTYEEVLARNQQQEQ